MLFALDGKGVWRGVTWGRQLCGHGICCGKGKFEEAIAREKSTES